MKYLNYFFILLFWVGLFLVFSGNRFENMGKKDFRFVVSKKDELKEYVNKIYIRYRKVFLKKEMQKELGEALSYIKNLTILGHGRSISAVTLLGDLSDISNKLKPAFLSMAHYLQTNDRDSAAIVLGNAIGTSIAKDVGIFLAGWEDIKPDDILENLSTYQSMIRNENLTEQRNRDELISDLIYFPVIINCMAVLLNFIYISYYVQQQELFEYFLN